MIHIPYKLGKNTISIPRNTDYSGNFTLRITSELTFKNYDFDVTDEGNSKRYYKFTIDTTEIEDAEYRYFLIQDDKKIADGIIQIGDLTNSIPEFLFYDAFKDRENIQYYPNTKQFIRLTTEEHLTEEASAITYSVLSSTAWTLTAYIRHHTESEWTQMLQEEHTEKNYQGTIVIGPQVEDYPKHFKLVVATNDGQASAEQEITQDAHYYFSVDVYSPSSAISASATELSYGIQYSERNTIHTGTFYIYKDDVLVREQPFGVYPYGFSTYMEISANTSSEPVVYEITGILDNGQQDSCSVIQEAYEEEPRFTMTLTEGDSETQTLSVSSAITSITYSLINTSSVWDTWDIQFEESSDGISWRQYSPIYQGSGSIYNGVFEIPVNTGTTHYYRLFATLHNGDYDTTSEATIVQDAAIDYKSKRFTIEMLEDGDIEWEAPNLYYDIIRNGQRDAGYQLDHSVDGLEAGDIIEFYTNVDYPVDDFQNRSLTATGKHNVYGNIMSLIYVDYEDITYAEPTQFKNLFLGNTNLVSAENLILPPLADAATYADMFSGCSNLIIAPVLPAKILYTDTYLNLFNGCSSLNYIKCLATNLKGAPWSLPSTENWTYGVAPSGTFVKSESMNDWTIGNNGIPSGWTIENYPDAQ